MLVAIAISALTLAQAMPPETVPMTPLPAPVQILENGACLDSPRPVPRVLQPPVERSNQIVRIDKVTSTATWTNGEIIGYLYTLADGSTWLGQRRSDYMSGADATAVNNVLASTHMPGQNVSKFPPQMLHGVATKYTQFFRVQIPAAVYAPLRIAIAPCVAWPPVRALPDPMM